MVNIMKQYKGYYIDKVNFFSKKDIDEFLKSQAINYFKKAVKYFAEHSTMEASIYCTEQAEKLVNNFGFTWEQVEALEIKTLAI